MGQPHDTSPQLLCAAADWLWWAVLLWCVLLLTGCGVGLGLGEAGVAASGPVGRCWVVVLGRGGLCLALRSLSPHRWLEETNVRTGRPDR